MLLRDLQAAIRPSGLQIFEGKPPPTNCLFPEVNPAKTKATPAIVEYPTNPGRCLFRFQLQLTHEIFLPLKTTTGEPSAMNAESGRQLTILPNSLPYREVGSPSKRAVVL